MVDREYVSIVIDHFNMEDPFIYRYSFSGNK